MSIFSRKAKQPQPIQAQPETVKTVPPEFTQFCAHCGVVGARNKVVSGDFYIGRVVWFLCDGCADRRIERHCNQSFHQRKEWPDTSIRMEAINLAKQKRQA